MSNNDKNIIERIDKAIEDLNKHNFTLYFFVADCRNVPNSSMEYIYEMAKTLQDEGYKVMMLYQLDNEYTDDELDELKRKEKYIDGNRTFVGVRDWMGDEYGNLPHLNISRGNWSVSPSDYLFIPEAFSSLMYQTYKLNAPCRRYVILQNYNYVTDFIPFGVEWKNYGITDVIATTDKLAETIKDVFPYVRTRVINPFINKCYRKPLTPHKLRVNVISKKQSEVNKLIKTFYWKYPVYKFISFFDVRDISREEYCSALKEGAIKVWIDEDTEFGHSPLQAMRCGDIVIGKIPDTIPEWMQDEEGIINNGFWVYNKESLPDVLAKVIASWMQDEIPSELIDSAEMTNKKYTQEEWNKNIKDFIEDAVNERINEFKVIKDGLDTTKDDTLNNDNKNDK